MLNIIGKSQVVQKIWRAETKWSSMHHPPGINVKTLGQGPQNCFINIDIFFGCFLARLQFACSETYSNNLIDQIDQKPNWLSFVVKMMDNYSSSFSITYKLCVCFV